MGGRLHVIDSEAITTAASRRRDRVDKEISRTYFALLVALREEGVAQHTGERTPLGAMLPTPVFAALERYQLAEIDRTIYLERQTQKLERALRAALASDGLTDELREAIMGVFRGTEKERNLRIPSALSGAERVVIDAFRRLAPAERTAVKALLLALAA